MLELDVAASDTYPEKNNQAFLSFSREKFSLHDLLTYLIFWKEGML